MSSNHQRDYLARHKIIRNKLMEAIASNNHACANVSQLAHQVGMDVRTVRGHLEIMEADFAGVFMDSTKKQFCTKAGFTLLANALKLNEVSIR